LGAELARFALDGVRGQDVRGRVLLAHGLLDLGDRLRPILAEIADDPDEARSELLPILLEQRPVDDIRRLVGQCQFPVPITSGLVPLRLWYREKGKLWLSRLYLAAAAFERISAPAEFETHRHGPPLCVTPPCAE